LLICIFAAPPFRISARYVNMSIAREIMPYGFWNFLVSLSTVGRRQLNPILIGTLLGPVALTPYSVASRLLSYATMLLTATVGVVTPTMTVMVGEGEINKQRQTVLRLARITTAYSIYVVCILVGLSRHLLEAWIGPEVSEAWVIVALLAVGEFLPMCVQPYADSVLALGKQRPVAWRGWAEVAFGLALSASLAPSFGLTGVAAAFAASATVFRGVLMLQYGARLINSGTYEYLANILSPLLLRSAAPALLLAVLLSSLPPRGIVQIAMCGVAFTAVYAGAIAKCIPEIRVFQRASRIAVAADPELPC
jgi:O-antigen/teichoic acid export membrane protein